MLGVEVCNFPFHVVQLDEELQGVFADLAAVVGPQLVVLAPRVRHAADLGYAELEASLVAAEVVGDELPRPASLVAGPG